MHVANRNIQIAQQAILNSVNPAVDHQFLAALPGCVRNGGVAHIYDLLDDVRSWIAEHKRIKSLLDEIHQLTVALIRTHVQHQKRKAGRP